MSHSDDGAVRNSGSVRTVAQQAAKIAVATKTGNIVSTRTAKFVPCIPSTTAFP
jgi:hypothetical protein